MYSTQKNIFYTQSDGVGILTLPSNRHRIAEGGTRLKGQCKVSTSEKPLISIITVVFNGELSLEGTILSVLNQSYDNIEYIIIDGGSTDGTLDIIKKYECAIDFWVSESDEGIYDAMNKGGGIAMGLYINFLNAGDTYYLDEVLKKASLTLRLKYPMVIGAAEFVYTHSQRVIKKARLSEFQMPNCHQSCFYLSSDFQKKYYSIEYQILSDFNYWFNEFVLNQADVILINEVICCYDMNGISNTLIVKSSKEKLKIFYASNLWRYRILGTLDVLFICIRITSAKILQKIGIRAILVYFKLKVFR